MGPLERKQFDYLLHMLDGLIGQTNRLLKPFLDKSPFSSAHICLNISYALCIFLYVRIWIVVTLIDFIVQGCDRTS